MTTYTGSSEPQGQLAASSIRHWSQRVHESVLNVSNLGLIEDTLISKLNGGSDNGQFIYVDSELDAGLLKNLAGTSSNNSSARIEPGEIVLEIEQQKVSGYTLFDVLSLVKQLARLSPTVTFRTVSSSASNRQSKTACGVYWLPVELIFFVHEKLDDTI